MVRADDGPTAQHTFGLAAQRRSAVPARVMKALQAPLIAAHQKYLLVAQREGLKRAGAREIAGTADINPVAVPDPLQLAFVVPRVEVRVRGQAQREIGEAVVADVIATGCAQHVPSPPQSIVAAVPAHYSLFV